MRQVYHLVRKEFRQIFRDKTMIVILFVVPFIQLIILGNAISTDVKHTSLLIMDQDGTPMSRELSRAFMHSEYFDVVGFETEYSVVHEAMDEGKAKLVLVLPSGFQRDVVRGMQPAVQLLVDGVDGNSAGVALGYVMRILQERQVTLATSDPSLAGLLRDPAAFQVESRYWYNPRLESRVFIIPGIIALILLIITVFLTSMGIVREKEIGTLEQLMVTPIRAWQLIMGKVIPFSVLGMLEIGVAMSLVYVLFGIGVEGSVPLLFAQSALFVLTTLGVGIFISTISETQQQALFVGWFFMIFAILLSGFFIPIANMPEAIQYLTYANPLRYFLVILREIYLKGTPLSYIWQESIALALFGVVVFSAAVLRFRQRLG